MLNLDAKEFADSAMAQLRQRQQSVNEVFSAQQSDGGASAQGGSESQATQMGVSTEMRTLLVNYCATHVSAIELKDVEWSHLAVRLGTRAEWLQGAAEAANANGGFWMQVLQERVKRVGASTVFRNVTWEKLESTTLNTLMLMAEKQLIRDPGELLSIANAARRINEGPVGNGGNGVNVNVNLGDGFMKESGLPSAGAKMTIDLSPRLASTLSTKVERQAGERVIDGEMIDAKELRSILEKQTQDRILEAEAITGESNA